MSSNIFVQRFEYSHCMMIYCVNRISSHDKTFECCQFHTGAYFITKLEIATLM